MGNFFLLHSLILLSFTTHFSQSIITHWQDIQSLKELKNSIQPNSLTPGSCLSSWNFSFDPCQNLFSDKFTCGFRCDIIISGETRITEISLDQAGYSGSISNISWNFPYLQILDLSNNLFWGPIPDSLSNLTNLKRITFSHNFLSGSPPISLVTLYSLEELYLDNNNLKGIFPQPALNGLMNLKRLEIQGNQLNGNFPNLGQLLNLTFIDASDNSISGEVNPENLPLSLIELSMRNNHLVGTIPAVFPVTLQVLDLSHNNLSGSVPSTLFNHPNLQQVTLSFNQLNSIQDPGYSGRGSGLIAVDLSNNRIRGFLPAFMGLMPKLSALSMENNLLSGLIPTQYALKAVYPGNGLEPFERLLLGGNYLFGPIPGPLMKVKDPGSVTVKLAGNCLYRCPVNLFFCEGGEQKSLMECKSFNHVIP
ncbi:probable LRR receptor-like serine/threonine-protein kinase At4g36180 [Impatiens glandulifera]|uniref:probable LRR receptor-like serine/threonine-protein kinase At4g36180 n=1 Tax=Impatiens glandulifera TaxID=253017 RepID=UPI001FB1136F|nr:probable LRR receptor-like serine/threonine-protein kinase At4g36180 [Impatiens glandulifera]